MLRLHAMLKLFAVRDKLARLTRCLVRLSPPHGHNGGQTYRTLYGGPSSDSRWNSWLRLVTVDAKKADEEVEIDLKEEYGKKLGASRDVHVD